MGLRQGGRSVDQQFQRIRGAYRTSSHIQSLDGMTKNHEPHGTAVEGGGRWRIFGPAKVSAKNA